MDRQKGRCAFWHVRSAVFVLAVGFSSAPHAETCIDAAHAAERHGRLPDGLLAAIGRIESGGWEWSVNGNGTNLSRRFTDAETAEAYTQSLLDIGRRIVDVGCFQINLFYHPEAFSRWQDAFDNTRSADAAAGILSRLYHSTGDWNRAIALYHSADPVRGQSYLQSVLAVWKGLGSSASTVLSAVDPYVVQPTIMRIPVVVWIPGGASGESQGRGNQFPHVVTP